MGLTRYKQKRNFKKSPEPQGGKPDQVDLKFVVQKHAASHLHYDFRLEMEGVLKSWAVPKGPSTDPSVKRLAMMVEDHPYDYRNFEGIIPSGYGAGTVMVWDEGTYGPAGDDQMEKSRADKELRRQLHAGRLKFQLKGKKLKGEWALVKAPARGDNAWLLMKVKDKYASTKDISEKNKSVISGKTLEGIKESPDNFWESKSPGKKKKNVPAPEAKTEKENDPQDILKKAPKTKFSLKTKPMLATLVDEAFDEPGWLYEVKWDGYRALAFMNKEKVDILSRNQKSFNDKFYPLVPALRDLKLNAILDGEVVVVNESGVSDFGALQNWRSEDDGELRFYLFDILWLDGKNLTGLPLFQRRQLLKSLVTETDMIRFSENFGDSATQFIDVARQMGLEGIIAKREDSIYKPGERSKDWLKIKASLRQEVIIGGYTRNEGSTKAFSSLLVGVYDGKEFVYTGKVGTGFNTEMQKEFLRKSKPLIIKKCPFSFEPDINKPSRFRPNPPRASATWLKPELVCEVNYAEITSDGVMRHPSFVGMRSDKAAPEIKLEKAVPSKKAIEKAQSKKLISAKKRKERKTLLNPSEAAQVKTVNGHNLKFNNLDKLFWPEEGYTKRDLINYYYQVAPYMLPYLENRPQSMNRFPNGIYGKSFYQKDVTGKAPAWVKTYLYYSEADKREKHFLVCNNEASLLYMASLACIEINPWSSTTKKPNHPDWCIIDLDPDKNTFEQVIKAAQVTHEILDGLGVPSYCKTSGSSGLHIYIPLGAKYTYEQSKEFARVLATMVHNELPEFTSIERATKNRGGKMYIDFLQNRPQATVAAPYSVRPKPGATVSMPLHWEEVKKGLKMSDFTLANAIGRVREMGDIFSPVIGKGINLDKIVKQF